MEQLKEFFLNWQAAAIALGSFIILGLIRAMGTKKDGDGKVIGGITQNRWFKAFTPLYPYALAVALVFLVPLPKVVVELGKKTFFVKLLFGLYAGWLSGYSFQVIKKVLENAFNMKFDPEPVAKVEAPKPPEPEKKPEPPATPPAK